MGHEITDTDSALFYGKPAWHGLGIVVPDALTPRQAMVQSGLGWTVRKSEGIDTPDGVHSDDYCAEIREDIGTILSVQSSDYEVVQNEEVFDLCEHTDLKVESTLSMQGGKKIVVLLQGNTFTVPNSPNDEVTQYLAMMSSHDGTMALSAMPTSVRIVCANTLKMAIDRSKGGTFRVTHKGDMEAKRESMRDALSMYRETGRLFIESVSSLSERILTTAEVQEFWLNIYGRLYQPVVSNPRTDEEAKNNLRAEEVISGWVETFDSERRSLNAPPSAWMAANAVTSDIQHKVAARGRKRSFESRAANNLNGIAQDQTLMVMRQALTLV